MKTAPLHFAVASLVLLVGLLAVALVVVLGGCAEEAHSGLPEAEEPLFVDVALSAGITHRHHRPVLDAQLSNIMSWMASVGAAVASADYDGDGWQDFFVTESRKGEPNLLYRNQGDGSFAEVGEQAGLAQANDARGTSMDAVWGDYDNDGLVDLYLVRWGTDSLYRNQGDGTFREVTAEVFQRRDGQPGTEWANGNAAIFLDFDRDGLLDIYVGNYFREVDLWHLGSTRIMHEDFERARNGGANYLYQQQGDGSFVEVAEKHGVADPGWTLAVGAADLDGDGWPDLYAADDFGPDQLFLSDGEGSWRNATESALGYDTKKGMNVDFGDFNNDGWLDIYVSNITTAEYLQEGNMLWYNEGPDESGEIHFTDVGLEARAYDGGWGWGAKFFDYDNDGDLDIVAVNGFISAGEGSYWYDLASWTVTGEHSDDARNWPAIGDRSFSGYERTRLWRNEGLLAFTENAGPTGLDSDRDGRGIAVVDYDNDGDLDLFIANQGDAPQLFRNGLLDHRQTAAGAHWLRVALVTDPSSGVNRDGIGTRVTLATAAGVLVRERDGGNGFAGQSEPRLHFGLGTVDLVEMLEVRWPDGGLQYFEDVAVDQILTLHQDPGSYAERRELEISQPRRLSPLPGTQVAKRALPSAAEIEGQLAELESLLRGVYQAREASDYRRLAAEYDAHDRAIAFLTERADTTKNPAWRIELSVAYVDKIPACGGLAAIVCKGSVAKRGLDEADKVLAAQPDSWLALYSRGMNHLHWPRALRHSDDAARDLERCAELQEQSGVVAPYQQRVYVALGQAYAKAGRYDEARRAWRRGLGRFPGADELERHLEIDSDDELLSFVKEKRSLQAPVDTDLSFYDSEGS